ncbi:hypothetical protein GCM10007977_031350 [Dactylosporangium sucinum]|uniref:Nucleotide exchange factor GrpE n=1 Tax=Dactylosporangium sucinum TaxID=1424081 RepID=A0A917WSI9_9ACTN|nr:hypothetical protein GCM10007977_031350 [Dactylosporangium sucinum]
MVIRLPQPGQERARIGVVLAGGRSPLRVRWEDDGSEEDVVLDNQHKLAARGSLRYEWLLDSAAVGAKIRSDPAGAIIRSIEDGLERDSRGHQELLRTYGIDLVVANAAWKDAVRRIAKRDDIRMDRKKRYIWEPPVSPVERVEQPEHVAVPDAEPERSATLEAASEPEPEAQPEPEPASLAVAAADPQPTVSAVSGEAGPRVQGDGGMPEAADLMRQAAQAPLRIGVVLGRYSDRELGDLFGDLPDDQRARAAALLFPVPRQLPELDRLGSEGATLVADALLHAAAEELEAAAGDADAEVRTAAVWLLRRLTAAEVLTTAAIGPLGRVIRAVTAGVEPMDLEAAARMLAKLISLAKPAEGGMVPVDVVADAVSALPLRPGSGRVAVVAAAARLWPDRIADAIWWRGASLKDVVDCADGGLGGVTRLGAVGERVIRPLVNAELAGATTRRALSRLLGLPAEFARQLPGDAVAGMFRRIGRNDPIVGGWLDTLSDIERADALRREVDEVRTAAETAVARAEAAALEAAELRSRSDRLEEMLRSEHDEAVGLRSAQERQIRIDVVRALADLAAEVEELAADRTGPGVLADRVRAMVAANGLEPIGAAGADAPFDPALHKPIAGRPAPGTQVTIIRPGYRWRAHDDVVLMSKAQVLGQ